MYNLFYALIPPFFLVRSKMQVTQGCLTPILTPHLLPNLLWNASLLWISVADWREKRLRVACYCCYSPFRILLRTDPSAFFQLLHMLLDLRAMKNKWCTATALCYTQWNERMHVFIHTRRRSSNYGSSHLKKRHIIMPRIPSLLGLLNGNARA